MKIHSPIAWAFGILLLVLALPVSAGVLSLQELAAEKQAAGNAEQHYRAGIDFLTQGKLARARESFEKALKLEPEMAPAMLGLADVAIREGDMAQARTWVGNAVRTRPEDPGILLGQAKFLYQEGNYREAERVLKKALSIKPDFIPARAYLGDLYLEKLEHPEAAAAEYRKVLEQDPGHAGAHYALGIALERLGKPEEAVTQWQEAVRLSPDNPLPHMALGRHFLAGEPARALEHIEKARAALPENAALWLMRARALGRLGREEEAIASMEKAVEIQPKLAPVWERLGMIWQNRGDLEKARKAYLEAIRASKKSWAAYNNLAWMEVEAGGDLAQALRWADAARKLQPGSFAVYDTLGWVYRARKQYPRAIAALERAAELQPKSADVWYHLGVVYSEAGKAEQARRALEKAARLAPDSEAGRKAAALLEKGS